MKYLYTNKYWDLNKEYNLDKLLYLMIDRPSKINKYYNNDYIWENKKLQSHRNYDLPSYVVFIYKDGTCTLSWNKNNIRHRNNDKPSVICYDGHKVYYTHGEFIKEEFIE